MTELPPFPLDVNVIGAGRVATAVASLLVSAGHRVTGVASRSSASSRRAAETLGSEVFEPSEELPPAGLVLIGAPDAAISEIASSIAPRVSAGSVVCHFAGSLGWRELAPVVDVGAHAAALHPVAAIPDVDAGVARLPGAAWGVTCSDDATAEWSRRLIAGDLRGKPVVVPNEARSVWHAAAVTTSNGVAALMAISESMLAAIGIEDPVEVLGPLAAGTVANAFEGGGGGLTLTGPVVRGEAETVRRHLSSLSERDPRLEALYRDIARLILNAAVAAGRLDQEAAGSIEEMIRE